MIAALKGALDDPYGLFVLSMVGATVCVCVVVACVKGLVARANRLEQEREEAMDRCVPRATDSHRGAVRNGTIKR